MLGLAVILITFVGFFGITIIIPNLPPGEIINNLIGGSSIISPIPGLSGTMFTNALISGFFWATIIFLGYNVAIRLTRKKMMMPKDITVYPTLQKATSDYIPPQTFQKKPIYKIRKRKTQVPLDQSVEKIEGIGRIYGYKLRKMGINSINDILNAGSTRKGRNKLAKGVGVSQSSILRWVNRADFFRINGIGKQYSSLLEESGVNSVRDLAYRDPFRLYNQMKNINRNKNLVKRTPPYNKVKAWIENAKGLQQIIVR